MPNYVKNIVAFQGSQEEIEKIFAFVGSEKEDLCFDFNKIIPMPESLNIEAGSLESFGDLYSLYIDPNVTFFGEGHKQPELEKAINNYKSEMYSKERYQTLDQIKDELNSRNMKLETALKIGKQYFDNYTKYGSKTWFDWCIKNWGTKWNACDPIRISHNIVIFDTAWDCPLRNF